MPSTLPELTIRNYAQGSISSTFYVQLLRSQIPNAQKTVKLGVLFGAFRSYDSKSCTHNVGEIDTTSMLCASNIGEKLVVQKLNVDSTF
jgi:hypothetical protein